MEEIAARLNEIIRGELGVPPDRVSVLINRYRKGTSVELNDVRRLLRDEDPFVVPNHFSAVAESIDTGVPIYEHARGSPVTKAIIDIAMQLAAPRAFGKMSFNLPDRESELGRTEREHLECMLVDMIHDTTGCISTVISLQYTASAERLSA